MSFSCITVVVQSVRIDKTKLLARRNTGFMYYLRRAQFSWHLLFTTDLRERISWLLVVDFLARFTKWEAPRV